MNVPQILLGVSAMVLVALTFVLASASALQIWQSRHRYELRSMQTETLSPPIKSAVEPSSSYWAGRG
jgi:hypothetical protein